jgi:DNA-3-methyladenine glycosylase II
LAPELLGPEPSAEDLTAAGDLAVRIFAADHDITPLKQVAEADPIVGRLVERFRGLRPVLIPDPFEALVWAILGQQINIAFAARLKWALVDRFGGQVEADGLTLATFPTPERLAGLEHERDLLPLQFSRQKSRYTIELARAVCEGRIDLQTVATLPAEETIAALTSLPGIGRWTAEYCLMRGFGHRDVMPAGDGGLKQIVGRAYGLGRLATEAEVRACGERWAGWRGYVAFYWWYALQQEARDRRAKRSPSTNALVESATGRTHRRR